MTFSLPDGAKSTRVVSLAAETDIRHKNST